MTSITFIRRLTNVHKRSSILNSFQTFKYISNYPTNIFEDSGLLKSGSFNFQVGAPNPTFLKTVSGHLQTAFNNLTEANGLDSILQYGVVAGMQPVRQEIANFLTRQYGQAVDWEDVFVTSGATSGLGVLMQHFFYPSQIIFTENPTYPLFAKYLNKDNLMKGVAVPMEEDGIDIDYFEEQLHKLPKSEVTDRRPYRAAAYLIPTYHNPTGCCYSPEKCRRLIELARQYEILIICDDVYNTLGYEMENNRFLPSPTRLFAYDDKKDSDYKGHVISNGSFAKIIAPGLRLGWYEAPQRIINHFRDTYLGESGGGQTAYLSRVVAEALRSELIDDHVNNLRVAHKERMSVVIDVIETNLSQYGVTITHPKGGYFLWVRLPPNVDSDEVLKISQSTENVTFIKGNLASLRGDFSNYLRISIAYYEADEIREGAERLCRSILTTIKQSS